MPSILIVGAGFAGAVVARELAEAGYFVTLIDKRPHIGGNCYTERDESTGVMLHKFGAHIFNTDDLEVWDYVGQFCTMMPFDNRVKAVNARGVFHFPINLHTINQFFGKTFNPREAQEFVASRAVKYDREPWNLEERALSMVGPELYETFIRDYTIKQWGRSPLTIPATILSRMPLRFDYNESYQTTALQGMPENGYTEIFEKMLAHRNIQVILSQPYYPGMAGNYEHVFYTGPIDQFFEYYLGRLSYRTIEYERFEGEGDLQGNAVLNYTDMTTEITRTFEHKHFAKWEKHDRSVLFAERFKDTGPEDDPFYAIRTKEDVALLANYQAEAAKLPNVTFLGRLGMYRYTTMAQTVREGLEVARGWLLSRIQ